MPVSRRFAMSLQLMVPLPFNKHWSKRSFRKLATELYLQSAELRARARARALHRVARLTQRGAKQSDCDGRSVVAAVDCDGQLCSRALRCAFCACCARVWRFTPDRRHARAHRRRKSR